MLGETDIKYFLARYAQAKTMAQAAVDPAVRSIHLEMANRYAALVEGRAEAGSEVGVGQKQEASA